MNPLQWLKAIYEVFGTPYPRASLVAVAVLGALAFVGVWLLAAKQVEKDQVSNVSGFTHSAINASGAASTKGPNSPAVTGKGNDIHYEQPSPPKSKKAKPTS